MLAGSSYLVSPGSGSSGKVTWFYSLNSTSWNRRSLLQEKPINHSKIKQDLSVEKRDCWVIRVTCPQMIIWFSSPSPLFSSLAWIDSWPFHPISCSGQKSRSHASCFSFSSHTHASARLDFYNIYQRVYGKRLLSISVLYYPFPEATSVSIILSILLDILGYISKYIAIMIYSPRWHGTMESN